MTSLWSGLKMLLTACWPSGRALSVLVQIRTVDVAVEIEVPKSPATIDLAEWDRAVEASMVILSGKLVVMGCTGHLPEAPRIAVPPATYQLI